MKEKNLRKIFKIKPSQTDKNVYIVYRLNFSSQWVNIGSVTIMKDGSYCKNFSKKLKPIELTYIDSYIDKKNRS